MGRSTSSSVTMALAVIRAMGAVTSVVSGRVKVRR